MNAKRSALVLLTLAVKVCAAAGVRVVCGTNESNRTAIVLSDVGLTRRGTFAPKKLRKL